MRTTVALLLLIGMASVAVCGEYTLYDCTTFDCSVNNTNYGCTIHYFDVNFDCIRIDSGVYMQFTSCFLDSLNYRLYSSTYCSAEDSFGSGTISNDKCTYFNGTTRSIHYFRVTGCGDHTATVFAATFFGVLIFFILLPVITIVVIVGIIIALRRRRRTILIGGVYQPVMAQPGMGPYSAPPPPGYMQPPYQPQPVYQNYPGQPGQPGIYGSA